MTPKERRDWVEEALADLNPEALFFGDLDAALIGYVGQGPAHGLAAYDHHLIIESLASDGMSRDDALEWFSFNVEGAYVGPDGPVILHRIEEEEE